MTEVLMIAGKPETIFKARDFEYLVEKHMGYEAAKYFREYAEKAIFLFSVNQKTLIQEQ